VIIEGSVGLYKEDDLSDNYKDSMIVHERTATLGSLAYQNANSN